MAYSYPLPNEDTINLSSSIVSQTDGNTRIQNGKDDLRLNQLMIQPTLCTLPTAAIDQLYDEVKGYATPAKECITALRFYFGAIENGGNMTMQLYYEPLFLSYDAYDPNTGLTYYNTTEKGNVYWFDGTTLHQVSSNELNDAVDLFKQNLTLKHLLTAPFEPFIQNEDVESGVLPFQTVYAMLHDNGTNDLMVMNCADLTPYQGTFKVNQSLLLNATLVSSHGDFAGMMANKVLTDPPYNAIFSYKLI